MKLRHAEKPRWEKTYRAQVTYSQSPVPGSSATKKNFVQFLYVNMEGGR